MNAEERRTLIDRYREGFSVVMQAVQGMTDDQLDHRASENDWTAREVVHHLADSEMTSAIRLRRLLAEEAPEIAGYDEEEFARKLFYDRPIGSSLRAFEASRLASAEILDHLSEEQWSRAGTHTDSGRYSVKDWLRIYARHAHDHADQIRRSTSG